MKNFGRLFREFTVIVLGVFVALAAESWWSEREDRRIERELREDMVAEFEANLRILDADIATNAEMRSYLELVVGVSDQALFDIPDDTLSKNLGDAMVWAGFDPEMGSAQALVESGNIIAIADRELRLRLARWAGLLENRRRFNLQAVEFQHGQVSPAISRMGADRHWSEVERRELRSLLDQLAALFDIVVANQRELQATAEDILAFLRESR